jgi:glutamate 5-kinase
MNKINIIKIGTNILTTSKGSPNLNRLSQLVTQIANEIINSDKKFIIVTSGAITCGSNKIKIDPNLIQEKQAAAAVGQILLMQEYCRLFASYNITIGQILLTKIAIENEVQKKNARNTILKLLEHNVIPIINENDSIATDEIDARFRDNDTLSSHVAKLINAKRLIILTDIDGVFTANPLKDKSATLIRNLDIITDDLINNTEDAQTSRSRGGMQSKLCAAKEAASNGTEVIIASGKKENIIKDIFEDNFIGTIIPAA